MADRDFALPVGHDENALSTIQVQVGKPYLQPVNIDDYVDSYSSGIEIWLPDSTNDKKIYASFNGVARYISSNNNINFNKIELTINDRTVRQINRIRGLLEPAPKKVIYKNVNEDSVRDQVENLINSEYQNALNNTNSDNWHPIMRIEYDDQRIKDYLDDNSSDLTLAITSIIDEFIDGEISLFFNCGDSLGDADLYSNIVNQISNGITFQNPRLIVLEMYEYSDNNMSAKYYYWRLLKNAYNSQQSRRMVSLVTETSLNSGEFDHPFLIALSIDLEETINPRVTISLTLPGQQNETDDVILFPIGNLREWEGTNLNNNDPSDLQWRLTNDNNIDFEIRRRPNVSSPNIRLCGETTGNFNACIDIESPTIPQTTRTTITNRVETIWTNFEDDIIDICEKLQIPSEVIVSIIGHESNGGQRAIRFEPLTNQQISQLNQDPNIQNSIVGAYVDLTTQTNSQGEIVNTGWGSTTGVPQNTADLNNAISPTRSTITWNQARQVISILPGRASPGIMQTLVSTATRMYNWLDSWFDDMTNEFNILAFPQNNGERYDWLLTARHSILVGAATIKYNYCNKNTGWNPVLIYGGYNAGTPLYQNNIWGVRFYDPNYVVDAGRHYNAFQNLINNEECRIRFWENL